VQCATQIGEGLSWLLKNSCYSLHGFFPLEAEVRVKVIVDVFHEKGKPLEVIAN